MDFNFSQYIQDNVEEAASGVKGENSVKIYGNDLETLEKTADSIAAVLAKVPGITDLAVLRSLGQPTIRIDVDRVRAARYGLAPGDVNAVVQTAIGGQSAGRSLRGQQRSSLSDDGASGSAVSPELGCHTAHPDQRRGEHRQRRDPDPAAGCGGHSVGVRRRLHLSRAAATLCADQIQRARPRSRRRGARGAARRRGAGDVAGRLPPRVGGRIRKLTGGGCAPGHRHTAVAGAHRPAAVFEFRQSARCAAGGERDSDGASRRHISPCASPARRSACPRRSGSWRCSASQPWMAF